MSFPVNVPGGGGGINQLTGGVVAGPGSGSVAAETVSQTKTVDCTGAGTSHSPASITAFDGTFVTVTGLGATGPVIKGYSPVEDSTPGFTTGSPLYGPALGGGTFSGTTAFVSAFDGVHTVTITGLVGMFPGMVGSNITFTGANSGGNNGTFPISAFISTASVQITNAGGVFPDLNSGSINWTTTVGTTANITAFSTPLATVTGLSGITPTMVGKYITFTGFGNSGNNTTSQIAAFISSTSVQVTNTSAVSPDSGATWNIPFGQLDGRTFVLTVNGTTLGTILNVINFEGLFQIQTTAPTSLTTGDVVVIEDSGNFYANNTWTITVQDSSHFILDGGVYAGVFSGPGGSVLTGPTTLTLNGSTNAASQSAFFAAITATWPTVTATVGGVSGTGITLTGSIGGTIVVGNGSSNGYIQPYASTPASIGVDVGGQTPTALLLVEFQNSGNNGTFIVHSWIDSATVTVLNPSGVSPDSGTSARYQGFVNVLGGTLYGPALSGAAASVTATNLEGTTLATITGLTGMTPAIVGQTITFTGASSGGNNGAFFVTGYISSSSVTVNNAVAVAPDLNNGAISWSLLAGTLNGLTIVLTVNGVGPTTLTLNTSTNAASQSALFAAIEATWPSITVSLAYFTNEATMVLTDSVAFGSSSTFTIGAGTANGTLGLFPETLNGADSTAAFAVSLADGSPPLSGASVLSLTGTPIGEIYLCTQTVGPFRCQVENTTTLVAQFGAPYNPSISPSMPLSVSSDGTTVNYDTPAPGTPTSYAVQNTTGNFSGNTASVFVDPDVPFTASITGSTVGVGFISIDLGGFPFYGLISNQSSSPGVVNNNGSYVLPVVLNPGQTRLVLSDGSTGMWSIPTVTEDNGLADRYKKYLLTRASTAANLTSPSGHGADLVWGTVPVGSPFTQGSPPPFVDGSFDTGLTDLNSGSDPIFGSANAGADIAVLGNILYMVGWTDGSPTMTAFSVVNGYAFASGTIPGGNYLPNTLIAFKEASDPSGSAGGPTDCLFIVTASTVSTVGLDANNNAFSQNTNLSGSWPGARGIIILGDDAQTSVTGPATYSSVGVWTDPGNGFIWAADVVNDSIGATTIYTGGGNPRAICLDRNTENFWVALDGLQQIQYFNINLAVGQGLLLTPINTIQYPSIPTVDDMLFDGAYLWVLSVSQNTYYRMTTNGFVVNSFAIQGDSGALMSLTTDSRLYCDGTYIYISGISRNNETSAIVRINPGTGLPVEYFNFPTFSTRGIAFHDNDVFVATAPTIINRGPTTFDGFSGTIADAIGGFAQFSDTGTPANWNPDVVGDWIYIQGGVNPANNGFFLITGWTSATQITINNANASSAEGNNGSLDWQMYGMTCGIQRLSAQPPGVDFGSLVSIIQTPAVAGWTSGLRLGARVVEYTGYSGPTTFDINVKPLAGTRVLFLDKDGNAAIHPLTISFSLSTVDGQSACSLQGPYAFLEIEWNGTTWLIIRQSNQVIGVGASRPANPLNGQGCFDLNIGLPIWWTGIHWINAAGTPV